MRKTGDTNILTIAFVSTDGSMDKQDIADYVASNIQDPLSRVNGVGDIDAYGSQYSMRIWLDPAKLNSFQMTAKDVTDAIESQKRADCGWATLVVHLPSISRRSTPPLTPSHCCKHQNSSAISPCGSIRTAQR
ncbi:putative multidrug efflux pump [Escherichia coli]|uniref:Putative multidrug efflux pump n=1 Tax=Escherichia coli TaxID=562 RepID=A0A377DNT5_ECOLX|nr:putative multidrug efflux pump [Escherichia coli]